MRILMLISLLGLGARTPDPAQILSQAVGKVAMCHYETSQKNLDDNHMEIESAVKKRSDVDPAKTLSLPILFKANRYHLEDGGHSLLQGREVLIINFSPLPEREQLSTASGEDARFNRAMNFLTGSVYIDQETGDIVQVETRIAQEVPYEKWFVTVFKLSELSATIVQRWDDTRWSLDQFEMEWYGRSKFDFVKLHERYTIRFLCSN